METDMPTYFNSAVLANILRYLIHAAQQKRLVPYHELENLFGLSHNMAGFYSGKVGDFCLEQEWPMLNALVINTTHCIPSHGFDYYLKKYDCDNWGEALSHCFKYFHQKSSRAQQVQHYSGLTKVVKEWTDNLISEEN